VIHNEYEPPCFVIRTTLTFSSITLAPLKTGVPSADTATGTAGKAWGTAGEGVAIAGVEIVESGSKGTVHVSDGFGEHSEAVTASGHLELSSATDRCTWKIVKA
jgi:hypothetical protein